MPVLRRCSRSALILALIGSLLACASSSPPGTVRQGEERPAAAGGSEARRVNGVGHPLEGPVFQGSVLRPPRGSSFAHGTLLLFNLGQTRLRLDQVRPVGVDPGLRPLGVRIAGPDRSLGFDQASAWPVVDKAFGRVRTAEGFVLAPADAPDANRGYEVLVGYAVVGAGRLTVRGVRIDYTDLGDGHRRSVTFRDTLAVCPDATEATECPVEEGTR